MVNVVAVVYHEGYNIKFDIPIGTFSDSKVITMYHKTQGLDFKALSRSVCYDFSINEKYFQRLASQGFKCMVLFETGKPSQLPIHLIGQEIQC